VEALGQQCVYETTDITDAAQCVRLVDAAMDAFGKIDVVVQNAARPDVFQPFEGVDLDEWRAIVDTNVFGALRLAHAAVPHMKTQGGGSIVLVNSMIIRKVLPLQGGYATSKAALITVGQALAKELGAHAIRVNTILPGWMWGPSVEGYFRMLEKQTGRSVQEQYDDVASQIALGEIPTDEACAGAAVFLASDLSSAVTGQALDVNGGEVFH
jgi:NAD(P)-dependent dehydrogenase (short-subunit alcohol dehydrogenase family)